MPRRTRTNIAPFSILRPYSRVLSGGDKPLSILPTSSFGPTIARNTSAHQGGARLSSTLLVVVALSVRDTGATSRFTPSCQRRFSRGEQEGPLCTGVVVEQPSTVLCSNPVWSALSNGSIIAPDLFVWQPTPAPRSRKIPEHLGGEAGWLVSAATPGLRMNER